LKKLICSIILLFFNILSIPKTLADENGIGKFLVSGQVDNGWEIFVVNEDGSGQRQITNSDGKAFDPKWAPDGSLFVCRLNDYLKMFDSAGRVLGDINLKGGEIKSFDWSPNGKKIVFSGCIDSGSSKIYLYDLGTKKINCITGCSKDDNVWRSDIAWSPDSLKVAFVTADTSDEAIIVDANTGMEISKTNFAERNESLPPNRGGGYLEAFLANLKWTFDSDSVYFERWGGERRIFFFEIASGKLSKWGKEDDQELSWSNEKNIAVFSNDSDPGIYISTSKGISWKMLTPEGHWCGLPILIEDGQKIAYLSNRGKDIESNGMCSLFLMNIDGTSQMRITNLKLDSHKSTYSWHLFKK